MPSSLTRLTNCINDWRMSGYSRRSKFQREKKDSYQFNKGFEDKKNLILVTSSRRKSSCLQEDLRNSLTFPLDTYRFLTVSEDFRPILKRIFAQSQYSKEYEARPSAFHSIIRILPTTYWTWSNADENRIMVLSPHGKLGRTKKQFLPKQLKTVPRHFKNYPIRFQCWTMHQTVAKSPVECGWISYDNHTKNERKKQLTTL